MPISSRTIVFTAYAGLMLISLGCQQQPTHIAQEEIVSSNTDAEVDSRPESNHEQEQENDGADKHDTEAPVLGSGRRGSGRGRGPGAMVGMRADMTTLHAMFADRDDIHRSVTNLADGAEAVTESEDERIASLIQEHVPAMEGRVLGNEPLPPMTFHPIFVELIKHSDAYTLDYEETKKGIKVRYTSDNPYVVMLVQEHAKLVSRFIKNGMQEIHKPYELPTLVDANGDDPSTNQ